ncbi:MAG: selenium metabolism-associated LysR family transcriptional regulator [Bacteroidia bacterium]
MIDFRLKVFHSVATNLSFTKAAAELFITQPAVTKNIQELETSFDLRLFDRKGNKIILTTAGKILLNHSEQIFGIYRQIEFDFNIIKKKYSGQLQLGASTTIGQYVLPPILAKFYQSFPDIRLSLLNDNTEKIETALIDQKIELGIVEGKTQNKQLKYIPFLKDELVAIVHAKSKLAKKEEISLSELKTIPLVFRERGSGTLEVIEHELSKLKIKLSQLQVAMYLGSTESIKSFLTHSNCIGFVSVKAVAKEIANGEFKIITIKQLDIKRNFYFVHLQGNLAGLADTFMRFALQQYNQK